MLVGAPERFRSSNGNDLVDEFGTLFKQHKAEHAFGLILNHRHFDMNPDERLVEYRGTSVPWTRLLDKAKPSSWLFAEDGNCLPYEFHYSPDAAGDESESPNDPKYNEFIRSFNSLLHQKDAVGLFGPCVYPGDDFEGRVEIRANTNLHPDDAPKALVSTPAAWFFVQILQESAFTSVEETAIPGLPTKATLAVDK
ncbi:phosphotransferase enzyme family domain-containing protein [Fusarium mundagurra]|uniref:Phosphotransferase enzyme family domain-containing protein n=1 Tax=Fusarium mundagurra TaxID=1567541 RepID=A0A8H6DC71_9HYPO|nr:phosphotransferase enzyme family domain-containing protein [Fusarium mundagurra]